MNFAAKSALVLLAFTLVFSSFDTAEAKRRNSQEQVENRDQNSNSGSSQAVDNSTNDSDIVRAVNDQRRVNFVEGGGMVVTKVLPDDNNGLKHQKWVVRLSNGKTMQAVYNSDMCPRVPVKVGDVVAMGGMFLWTNTGALLHWLHHDPRGNRPDGYVFVNGKYYCKD